MSLLHVCVLCLIMASFGDAIDVAEGDSLDEAILTDIMFQQGSESCTDHGKTKTTFVHTPSPTTWSNGLHEEKNFLAQMTHPDETDPHKAWTIRIGKGGSIYSMRSDYGEAIPPQKDKWRSAWVDEVIQGVAVDLDMNGSGDHRHFIHQAGTYKDDKILKNEPFKKHFYSPNIAKHCKGNTCIFGTWGQIAWIPNVNKSNLLFFTLYRDCGNGLMEYIQMFDGDFGNNNAYINMPWAGVRTSTLPNLYLSNTDLKMEPKRNPINQWGQDDIMPTLPETGGYTTFRSTGPPSLSFVHGRCTECWDPDNTYFRAHDRIRFGKSGRDFTVFTVNGQLKTTDWKKEVFVHRQYIIHDKFQNIEERVQNWIYAAGGKMLTPNDFGNNGRIVEMYSDNDSVFGVVAASARLGTSTSCSTGTIVCSGRTVPTYGLVSFFAISCGNETYVGSDKYHFSPPLSSKNHIRSYICDYEVGYFPEWKLLGYFPDDGSCSSLHTAKYDPSFCTQPATPSPTAIPTSSTTNSPTDLPTSTAPTDSPTGNPTHSPTTRPNKLCKENMKWYNGKKSQNCAWVSLKPQKRCKNIGGNNVIAEKACPIACGKTDCRMPVCWKGQKFKPKKKTNKFKKCSSLKEMRNNKKKKYCRKEGMDKEDKTVKVFAYEVCKECTVYLGDCKL